MENAEHHSSNSLVSLWLLIKSWCKNRWVSYGFDLIMLVVFILLIMTHQVSNDRVFLALFILARPLYSVLVQTLDFFAGGREKNLHVVQLVCLIYLFCVTIAHFVLH